MLHRVHVTYTVEYKTTYYKRGHREKSLLVEQVLVKFYFTVKVDLISSKVYTSLPICT